jgi:hypothetical protein
MQHGLKSDTHCPVFVRITCQVLKLQIFNAKSNTIAAAHTVYMHILCLKLDEKVHCEHREARQILWRYR